MTLHSPLADSADGDRPAHTAAPTTLGMASPRTLEKAPLASDVSPAAEQANPEIKTAELRADTPQAMAPESAEIPMDIPVKSS